MTSPAVVHLTAAGRTLIRCREYGVIEVEPERVMLPDGSLRILAGVLGKYVTADFKDGRLRLRANGVSGLFALTEDITVQVRPRFPLTNLTHMTAVCGHVPTALPALREYRRTDRWQDWMLDVVADALLTALDVIEDHGLLRTYRRRTESSSYPHGRIEMAPTIRRFAARGVNHKAVYSWFERTADNPPNRCLKDAVSQLHSRYSARPREGDRHRITRLGNALRILAEVSADPHHKSLNSSQVRGTAALPEARAYYRPALDLAVSVLQGDGFDLDASTGSLLAGSLLVKTEDLFEQFIRLSLRRALLGHPGVQVEGGNAEPWKRALYTGVPDDVLGRLPPHQLASAGAPKSGPTATPDIVFATPDGSFPLVADVKYTKVHTYADRDELEQVLLYGVRYSSPAVLTIHPRRPDTVGGLVISGRVGDILVAQYRVDLAADDLDAEMVTMGETLAELIAAGT